MAAGTGSALAYPPRLRPQPATMDGAVQQQRERRRGQEPEPEPELVEDSPKPSGSNAPAAGAPGGIAQAMLDALKVRWDAQAGSDDSDNDDGSDDDWSD